MAFRLPCSWWNPATTTLRHSSTSACSSPAQPGSKASIVALILLPPSRLTRPPLSLADYYIRTGLSLLASSAAAAAGSDAHPPPPGANASSSAVPARPPSTSILAQSAVTNFALCQGALQRQTKYWLGVGWVRAVAQRKGMKASRSSIKTATEGLHTFVSGAEMVSYVEFRSSGRLELM